VVVEPSAALSARELGVGGTAWVLAAEELFLAVEEGRIAGPTVVTPVDGEPFQIDGDRRAERRVGVALESWISEV
jgi:hypothetical protein